MTDTNPIDYITADDVRRAAAWLICYLRDDPDGRRVLEETGPIHPKALADVVSSSFGLFLDPEEAAAKVSAHLAALTEIDYGVDEDGQP